MHSRSTYMRLTGQPIIVKKQEPKAEGLAEKTGAEEALLSKSPAHVRF